MRTHKKYNLLATAIIVLAMTCTISFAQRGSRGSSGTARNIANTGERTVGRSRTTSPSSFRSGGGSVRYSNVGRNTRSKYSSGGSSSYPTGRSTVSSDQPSFPSERSRVSSDRPAVGTGRSKYTSNRGTIDITPAKKTERKTTRTTERNPVRTTDKKYTAPAKTYDRKSSSYRKDSIDRKTSRFDRTPSNYGSVRHSSYRRPATSNISTTPTRKTTYRPSNIKTASRQPTKKYSKPPKHKNYPRYNWGPGRPGSRYLPRGARPVYYHKRRYYCYNHRYYRPYFYFGSVYYYPVAAPIGIYIDTLPSYYSLVHYGGVTYYVINGDYYIADNRGGKVVYVVTDRPGLSNEPQVISDAAYPNPFTIVKAMSSYLNSYKSFTVVVSDTYDDISESGMDIQRSSRRLVYLSRPDQLEIQYEGEGQDLEIVYNGRNLSLVNIIDNTYSITPMPDTIDKMLDKMADEYGVTVPIADFLYSDPEKALMTGVRTGQYVGLSMVDDIKCHHLAFTTDDVDWELWIETGGKPLPRRLVITYKNIEGSPRYIMTPHTWDMGTVPGNAYELSIPAGAKETKMKPVQLVEDQDAAL